VAGASALVLLVVLNQAPRGGPSWAPSQALAQGLFQVPDFDQSYKTGPESADAGDTITYTIVAVNGGDAITGVLLTDPIPNGATYVPGSCRYRRPGESDQSCTLPEIWQEDFATGDRITTTFSVQVTAGSMAWSLENCAYLAWDGQQVERCTTTEVNPGAVCYLPLVMRNYPPLPDLRVTALTVEPANPATGEPVTVTVAVANVGSAAAGPFWVDLYFDPDPPPTQANQPWDQLCASDLAHCFGVSWYLAEGLAPGEALVLSSRAGYEPDYTRWPGYFVESRMHQLYAFADSWNDPLWYGAVRESNEGLDNRYGPVSVDVAPGVLMLDRIGPLEWLQRPVPRRPSRP